MPERRIRVAQDKVGLIKDLTLQENSRGVFRYIVDLLTFSAALGFANGRRMELTEPAKSPDPIRQAVFQSHGYDTVLNMLAVADGKDASVLGANETAEDLRVTVFEEYANGGLEILKVELKGSTDYLQSILLLIMERRKRDLKRDDEMFDIRALLDQ